MSILRVSAPEYGGVEVWDSRDPQPIYLAPHLLPGNYAEGQLTPAGAALAESLVTDRLAAAEIEANMAELLA